MIIDAHLHVWPDKIAPLALGNPSEGLERFGDGTTASAIATMQRCGVDRSVVLPVADSAKRVESANRFAGGLDPEWFIPFGTFHLDLSPEENVESLRRNGCKGVKVHSLFTGVALDDPKLLAFLDALGDDLPALFHIGPEFPGDPRGELCTPAMIAHISRELPALKIIAAHLGGYHAFEDALEHVNGLNVHLDTSWPPSVATVGIERVRDAIASHGTDKVVFATDWPMADPAAEIETIRSLGFSDSETDAILGGNFARLVDLDPTKEIA